MIADSMRRLPDRVLRRFFGVKCNSYPAVAALITRGVFPERWGAVFEEGWRCQVSGCFGIPMVINPHKSYPSRYSHMLQRPYHGYLETEMYKCTIFCSDGLFSPRMLFSCWILSRIRISAILLTIRVSRCPLNYFRLSLPEPNGPFPSSCSFRLLLVGWYLS